MILTVLGAYGPYPPAGGACSGYLVQEGSCRILLDCGNGVLSRLQQHATPWELDAVVVSHLHYDHISDLFIYRYAMDIARSQGMTSRTMPVYAPGEPVEEFSRIPYKDVFCLTPLEPEETLNLGPFVFSFLATRHPLPCLAIKIECGQKKLVFTGDTEYFPELENFVQGCHLLLCEASYQEEDKLEGLRNHLFASQAGSLASNGMVGRLLLTHLPPVRDAGVSLAEARVNFERAELAVEGRSYNL